MGHAPHLLVIISPHGFGHTGQTAPVINALRARLPALRVSLRTTVSSALLKSRFQGDFTLIPEACDFGMHMTNALQVDATASAHAYAAFHQHWEHRVQQEAAWLKQQQPDLVFSNIAYLPLAAAAAVGIPAVALCSLNWADIYHAYCGQAAESEKIHAQILAAYQAAKLFIQVTPHMSMTELANRVSIGPVAQVGRSQRAQLNARLGMGADEKLVLINLGGLPARVPVDQWPRLAGIRWLVPEAWGIKHPHALSIESSALSYIDLLCSCDTLIGKPGYGSFAEAACNGIPMLYKQRGDWPEEPYLVDWLTQHGRIQEINAQQLAQGTLVEALHGLWQTPGKSLVAPSGIAQVVDKLLEFF